MTFKDYCDQFETILNKKAEEQPAPYDNPHYLNYTKLNWTRMNRWLKTGKLTDAFKTAIQNINTYQHWIIITEPWCGDAAHSVPFLEMASHLNPLIKVTYELRDSEPFRINQYLTNNGKSIPKLIIRNADGYDLATWGPRPKDCQEMYKRLTAEKADFDTVKMEIQKWYNANKGQDLQEEMTELLK
ncbi:thioredoxin family protein [Chitinophaga sancti]|uniref:thioredoxin family protein n=1 Tax=Chitinophaga sancti TaxID=1004 RepID=UPI002A74CBDD|nr:thioredoxin family protein [Chitinophaga sancti]WPQ60516.1 thioredoxin family protein [Chitinophaga sancti]